MAGLQVDEERMLSNLNMTQLTLSSSGTDWLWIPVPALLAYLLLYMDNSPIAMYQPLLIFGIPLIYLITRMKRNNERMTLSYDR
jgi:hypothetical protein